VQSPPAAAPPPLADGVDEPHAPTAIAATATRLASRSRVLTIRTLLLTA
jgi:hypothetical protein